MGRKTKSTKKEETQDRQKEEPRLEQEEKSPKKIQNPVLKRALKERMYFLSVLDERGERIDGGEGPSNASQSNSSREACFLLTGQTGNLYTVRLPTARGGRLRCNCPDHLIRKRSCKHILFIAHRVLKLPYSNARDANNDDNDDDDEIRPNNGPAQLSERHREIRDAVANMHLDSSVRAPVAVQRAFELVVGPELLPQRGTQTKTGTGKTEEKVEPRNVEAGDECPICYEQFEKDESMLFCTKGCGKGVHEDCMRRYAEAAAGGHGTVRCVFCRAEWIFPEDEGQGHSANGEGLFAEGIPLRGLLNQGRLIDLSSVATSSFSASSANQRRTNGVKHDDDDAGEEADTLDYVNGESMDEKKERQKDERDERAKRRAERTVNANQETVAVTGRRTRAKRSKSEPNDADDANPDADPDAGSGKRRRVGTRSSGKRS